MSDTKTAAVYIPRMHQQLAPGGLASAVAFLDPGCGPEAGYSPSSLPMDRKEARWALRDMLAWGGGFAKASDVAALAAQQAGERKAALADELRGELNELSRLAGVEPAPSSQAQAAPQAGDPRSSQMVLILAWAMEEGLLEAAGAGEKLDAGWNRFAESLGLDDGEDLPGAGASSARPLNDISPEGLAEYGPAWQVVLEHLLRFIPVETPVVSTDMDMLDAWREGGLAMQDVMVEEAGRDLGGMELPGDATVRRLAATGRELCGRTGTSDGRDWLDATWTVYHVSGLS